MLESIYRAAGLRVGLFTSPHLVAFGERIQVNRRLISEEEITALVTEAKSWVKQFSQEEHPTFFEVVTVMALRYFAAQNCDLVVWETGLGGRLDATNIVKPVASVITNIQYDHQKYLGETLASIAAEKAGIIKLRTPVITGADVPDALDVIQSTAARLDAPLTIVHPQDSHAPPLDTLSLPLLGEHQKRNAAVAIATVRALHAHLPVSEDVICTGLSRVHWPGRLQLVTKPSRQRILLDGAHNIAGAECLLAALQACFREATPVLILGILRDKDWGRMCEILAPRAGRILLVPVHSERSAEPHGLAEVCRRANPLVQVVEHSSLADALAGCAQDSFVLIAGSLYLIGEAMELLHLSATKSTSERGLNEWTVR
jgi:dihydrofolate synthase/folylpolyglutamate synthase